MKAKYVRPLLAFVSLLSSVSILMLASGCDTTAASDDPTITPSSAVIMKGQSLQFTASGGYEYTWELDDDSIGSLSTRTGSSTIYTALTAPSGSNSVSRQILKVTSAITGSSSASNANGFARSAEAFITHIPTSE